MMKYHEKRQNIRIQFEVPVIIDVKNGIHSYCVSGNLGNISLKGLYILTEHRPVIGSSCTVSLHLADFSQKGPKIVLKGTVVRHDDKGIGIYISEADVDSLIHLTQLMLHNSPNPDLIDQELLDWNKDK